MIGAIAAWVVVLISTVALIGAAATGGAVVVGSGGTHVNVSAAGRRPGQQIAAARKAAAQSGDANAKVVAVDPNTP